MSAGPKLIRFFWPIIKALRDLGGSAKPRGVVDSVVKTLGISDDERAEQTKSGAPRISNQVHWARNYLVWAGLIDGSHRGRWELTAEGNSLPLDGQDALTAYDLFNRVRAARPWGSVAVEEGSEDDDTPAPIDATESAETSLRENVRSAVLALGPGGFENLCKRLLTELGLVQLRTVGQAGDRGIDIEGHLRVSPVVSFRVGVQCKRYVEGNKVAPHQIRELQGALGPFDRGIFVTTSVFTSQASEQASSPGYKPIDLIDGERLIDLLIENNLGTRQVTVVDGDFFSTFA